MISQWKRLLPSLFSTQRNLFVQGDRLLVEMGRFRLIIHSCTLYCFSSCLPTELFCDGHPDCADNSDEGWCDPKHDPNAAPPCDYSNCTLPNCFCSSDGTLIPNGMLPTDVPQMITITFDDAVNDENWDLYQDKLFPETYKNPNGCPIHGTFYVSHQYTNYAMVQKLWNQGKLND